MDDPTPGHETQGMPAVLRQVEFATWLGCSRSYVTRLKAANRLVMTANDLVDVPASMARLAATRGQRYDVEQRWADARGMPVASEPAPTQPATASAAAPPSLDDDGEPLDLDAIGLRTRLAAMRKAEADARMAQRRDETDAGAWLARDQAERELTRAVGVLLNLLVGIPDRLAPQLASLTDADTIRAVLRDELERYQATVARELTAVAAQDRGAA